MKIGILGAGNIGATAARLFVPPDMTLPSAIHADRKRCAS